MIHMTRAISAVIAMDFLAFSNVSPPPATYIPTASIQRKELTRSPSIRVILQEGLSSNDLEVVLFIQKSVFAEWFGADEDTPLR
jgi:hypothetical protein